MGDELELRRRADEDERATLARIEALQAQLAAEQRHLGEVRLFQAMLNGYAGVPGASAVAAAPGAGPMPPGTGTPDSAGGEHEEMSSAQAEELERLNRLFGLSAGN